MSKKSDSIIEMEEEEEKDNTQKEKWKKLPNLKILSLNFNQNNTLLVVGTNYGYRIFDVVNNFQLISDVDKSQKDLGPLKLVKILYKSSLVGFVGAKENERFKENTFYFYSDEYKKILSKISFKQNIKNFYISSSLLFICFISNVYVFELYSMRFIHNIQHCMFNEKIFSIVEDPLEEGDDEEFSITNKVISLAYVSTYQNIIKIQRYIIKKNIPTYVFKDELMSDFEQEPSLIKLIKGLKIIVLSRYGNQLHIYDYVNNSLLYCIYLGHDNINMIDISLGIKNKFLMLYHDTQKIDIIKMNKDSSNAKCTCSKAVGNKFSFKRLKTYDFSGSKGKVQNVFSSVNISYKKGVGNFCCEFDPKEKNIINVISDNGYLTVYQFDRKQIGDKFKEVKNICLFQEDLNEF